MAQPPYTDRDGYHRHECRKCGTIWEHQPPWVSGICVPDPHDCPACGHHETYKYTGPLGPVLREVVTTTSDPA